MKAIAQTLLQRAGLYHRIKSSIAYDLYWNLADPKLVAAYAAEVAFFRRTLVGLKPGDLIFDIGANRGHKTDIFLRLGGRVIAVEPDEVNQRVLSQSFLRYRIIKKAVTIVGKAVSEQSGMGKMWVDQPGSAKNTLNRKWVETLQTDTGRFGRPLAFADEVEIETTTLDELIRTYGAPFYVKIDVEGHEPDVLRGLHRAVPFLSFEVNLPEFRSEAIECVELLDRLRSGAQFNYTVDCSDLALTEWCDRASFLDAFARCDAPSLEIFCRSAI